MLQCCGFSFASLLAGRPNRCSDRLTLHEYFSFITSLRCLYIFCTILSFDLFSQLILSAVKQELRTYQEFFPNLASCGLQLVVFCLRHHGFLFIALLE